MFDARRPPSDRSDSPPPPRDWSRTDGGVLPNLGAFTPDQVATPGMGGVYVIGYGAGPLSCLLVGQADDLAAEIAGLRAEPSLRPYEAEGGVFVTWLETPDELRNGVERFVAERLRPLYDCHRTSAKPRKVPLPGEFMA